MMNDILKIDYNNSFVQWSSPSDDHTPRMALQASCKIREKGGEYREYFLTHTCIGEQMYRDKELIHRPTSEVHLVLSNNGQFMIVKHFAEAAGYTRVANRVGETIPTHDGRGSTITEMNTRIRHYKQVIEMTEYEEVHDAMVGNLPILGRTHYIDHWGDDAIEVIAEYPVYPMNARHQHATWQIDAGPLLIPDFNIEYKLEVEIFRRAFFVYNKWDYTECVRQLPVMLENAAFPFVHYSDPKSLGPSVSNQLFVAKIL